MWYNRNKKSYSIVFGKLIPDEVIDNHIPQPGVRKSELIKNYLEISKTCLYQASIHLSTNKVTKPLTKDVLDIIEKINCIIHNRKIG